MGGCHQFPQPVAHEKVLGSQSHDVAAGGGGGSAWLTMGGQDFLVLLDQRFGKGGANPKAHVEEGAIDQCAGMATLLHSPHQLASFFLQPLLDSFACLLGRKGGAHLRGAWERAWNR